MTAAPSQARVAKLKELERELCRAAGLRPDKLSAADRIRVEHCALLQLQASILKAKLLSGGSIDTGQLITIEQSISELLPAKPQVVTVRYLDSFVCEDCKRMRDAKAEEAAKEKALPPPAESEPLPNAALRKPRGPH